MASPEKIGITVSAAGHAGLILWAALGGWLFQPQDSEPVEMAEVSLMSETEFAAISAWSGFAPFVTG